MTARELMARLGELGVELSRRDDRVRVRAPEGVLTPELRDAIAARKAELLELLPNGGGRLGPGQERIWRLARRDPESAAYNLCEAVRARGPLDRDALDAALEDLVVRHDALRTRIRAGSPPMAELLPAESIGWTRTSVEREDEPEAAARARVRMRAAEPFDLDRGPLVRFELVRLGHDDHVIAFIMHHLVSDGWSFEVLYAELAGLYEARRERRPAGLPDPLPWTDVARRQRAWEASDDAARARAFWRDALAPPLDAPESGGAHAGGYAGARITRRLDDVATLVEGVSAATNATPYMVLLAAFAAALSRRSGHADVFVCSPVACREDPDLRGVIGYVNNLLPLRIRVDPREAFGDLADRVRKIVLGAFEHRMLPFHTIVDAPHLARVPVTHAMLAFQGEPPAKLELPDVSTSRLQVHNGTANFGISLYLSRRGRALDAEITFQHDVLPAAGAARLLDVLVDVLRAAAGNPDAPVGTLVPGVSPPTADRARPDGGTEEGESPVFDPLEVQLMLIWERVLGVWPIRLHDDFFELGGHSLLAVRLLDEIEGELGRELPLATFFQVTTIRELARALREDGWRAPEGPVVEMRSGGSGRPLFLVHSFEGHVFFYNELAHAMDAEHSVYGLQAPPIDGRSRRAVRVPRLADLYLEEIRRVQPRGPYSIAAMCFGVAPALEIAGRLEDDGESVQLIFLDSVLDGRAARRPARPVGSALGRAVAAARRRLSAGRERLRQLREAFWPGPYGRRERRMRLALIEAWDAYEPRSFGGVLTLIRSQDNVDDRGKDWQAASLERLTGARIRTETIPGGHFALLREPNVHTVARRIVEGMAEDRSERA